MNIFDILKSTFEVLVGSPTENHENTGDIDNEWRRGFDLSVRGFIRSFIAVALYIPLGFVVANSAVKFNDNTDKIPYGSIAITLMLIALVFPLIAYVLCMVFDKMEGFRPWVIVRNWSILIVLILISAVFGLYLIELLPFSAAYVAALLLYLGTLFIDIRLASRVAGFDWIGAVFAGILISTATMMVLLLGVSQNLA